MRYAATAVLFGTALALGCPAPANDMRIHRDIPYAQADGVDPNLLSLDVYAPKTEGLHSVLVMIHGGGWRIGDKSNRAVGIDKGRFFTGEGYVYVSINYRLSPAVVHPVHVQDVAKALAYVRSNVATYGGDPERIFVMGHSAGAHLAALVATDHRYLEAEGAPPSLVKGVILLDGAGYDIPVQYATAPRWLRDTYAQAFGTDPEAQRDASPVTHVVTGKAYPPFLIFHVANREASRLQSEAMAAALTGAGGEAEVIPAEGKTHGSLNRDIGRPGDIPTQAITQFLEELG